MVQDKQFDTQYLESWHSLKTNSISYNYYINNEILQKPVNFVDLGVTFQRSLTFIDHIDVTESSGFQADIIHIDNHGFRNITALETFYSSFLRSQLEYV